MADPVNLMLVVQEAVFAAMDERISAELGGAHQHVIQDTKPPLNIIGAIDASDQGNDLVRFETEIQSIYRGADRRQLLAQIHAVYLALHARPLTSADATIQAPKWLNSSVSDVGPDGQTYVGISTFEIYAEPA